MYLNDNNDITDSYSYTDDVSEGTQSDDNDANVSRNSVSDAN